MNQIPDGMRFGEASAGADRAGHSTFVGRERELAELRRGLQDSVRGQTRFFLLAGEPGIGKTRLADEVSATAAGLGAKTLWGRCWESGGAPPYWPWVQVVRSHLADLQRPAMHRLPVELAQIVPELAAAAPAALTQSSDPEEARFRLFDSVSRFLRAAASERPLMVILDDVHAADQPTLRLLQFLTHELRRSRLLLLGTYREAEASQDPALGELISDLGREGQVLSLRGWSPDEVARFSRELTGTAPAPPLIGALHRATGGNPFFTSSLLRLLVAEHRFEPTSDGTALSDLQLPDQIRIAVHRHLQPLPVDAVRILTIGAVLGREFDLDVLVRVAASMSASEPVDGDSLLRLIDAACRAGVLQRWSGSRSRYAFAHALIRETLYDDIAPSLRCALHCAAGEAVEFLRGSAEGAPLAEIAHHLFAAAPGGDLDKAITYQQRAGDAAMRSSAYEYAAAHYARALQLAESQRPLRLQRQLDVLLALAEAQMKGVESAAAEETFQRAATLARQVDDTTALARAALGLADIGAGLPGPDKEEIRTRLFEDALAALGPADSALRARILGRLAVDLYYHSPLERRRELTDAAVQMATRLGDKRALGHALADTHYAMWTPDTAAERWRLAARVIALADEAGDTELLLRGLTWQILDSFELGDAHGLDQALARFNQRADALQQPRYQWIATHLRAVRALSRGDFTAAESLGQEAFTYGERAKDSAAVSLWTVLVFATRGLQGRLDEFAPAMEAHLAQFGTAEPANARVGLAFTYTECGRMDAAREQFEHVASDGFRRLLWNNTWLTSFTMLGEVCAALGDRDRAAYLYDALAPYADRIAVIGHPNTYMEMPVAQVLGMLATLLECWESATAHFEQSLDLGARLGARPHLARTQYEYARMLLARGAAPDHPRAQALLEQSLATARALGMDGLAAKAQDLAPRTADATLSAATGAVATGANVFRREGEYWTVVFDGMTSRLRGVKGFEYIAYLLRHPDTEVHAGTLVSAVDGGGATGADDRGDAGELLDARARAEYKERLDDLREHLREADAFNDAGRSAALRQEIDALTREISRAVGLGGRERRAGSSGERARVKVTRAIGKALHKITAHHAALGDHLSQSIKTGTFCQYRPRSSRGWQLLVLLVNLFVLTAGATVPGHHPIRKPLRVAAPSLRSARRRFAS